MKQSRKASFCGGVHRRAIRLCARFKTWGALKSCYAVALAGAVFCAAFTCLWDSVLFGVGYFTPQTITLSDTAQYQLHDFQRVGQTGLLSLEGDPQLLLTPTQPIRFLRLVLTADDSAGERDLYYHYPGMGFAPRLRVWPVQSADGSADSYTLPLLTGRNVRIDLAIAGGTAITLSEIQLNTPQSVWRYFVPTLWQVFWFLALPPLVASALQLGQEVRAQRKR